MLKSEIQLTGDKPKVVAMAVGLGVASMKSWEDLKDGKHRHAVFIMETQEDIDELKQMMGLEVVKDKDTYNTEYYYITFAKHNVNAIRGITADLLVFDNTRDDIDEGNYLATTATLDDPVIVKMKYIN